MGIVLIWSEPFTTKLIESNFDLFRYELDMDKFGRQTIVQPENRKCFGFSKKGLMGRRYNPQKEPLEKLNKSKRGTTVQERA